ncbi:O-antigen ligase family protein [Thiomicrospira cyclica]|uniref:O-antigen polymerase n=1 Tax=Thiomicrospira cyclica (strain DSM 14477 / JCM 11371 / ALM1) TaxID=717773 RepID=F6DCW8_THICA|nr:O-antigen ligase family protein [Thiomicrospira cyclica]AEG31704.1 O-antigen polymerase [Thiomicrospira cyclica ALM1]
MDQKMLGLAQLQQSNLLKVFFLSFSFWIILLPGPLSFESLFLALGILAIAIYRQPLKDLKKLPWQWFLVAIVFFVALTILPIPFHQPMGDKSWMVIQRRLATILVIVYVFILFWQLRFNEHQIWVSLIIGTGAIAFYLGYEIWHLDNLSEIAKTRFGTTFTNPLRFGIYSILMAVVLMGGYIWAFKTGLWAVIFLTLALFVALSGAVMSQTRSAWLGFPEAVLGWSLFYLYYLKRNNKLSLKQILLGIVTATVLLGSAVVFNYSTIEQRVMQGKVDVENYFNGTRAGSIGQRFVMWEAAWLGFKQEPWRGIGIENARDFVTKTSRQIMQERFNENRALDFGHRHNQFIEEAYTRGIFAFLGLLATMGYLFWYFIVQIRQNKKRAQTDITQLSPWPVMGLLVTIAYFLAMQPEAILNLSAGIAHFIFLMTFLIVMSRNREGKVQ